MSESKFVGLKADGSVRAGSIKKWRSGVSRNVFVLGLVSFFTDLCSEMIAPIRILFFVLVLRTPLPIVGLIEGVAESAASLVKLVSSQLADRAGERVGRKPLILFGYSASSLAKPLLAAAGSWPLATLLIFVDRVGKGVRTGPRDTLLADSTDLLHRDKAFGLHRNMNILGAALGPLCTYLILLMTNNDLRAVFGWTALPGILSVLAIVLFLRERKPESGIRNQESGIGNQESGVVNQLETPDSRLPIPDSRFLIPDSRLSVPSASLGTRFWMFTLISAVFALGNSSSAFLFLRTAELQKSILLVPLIYFGSNLVYALFATPLSVLSYRFGRMTVLMGGYAVFGLIYFGWASATQAWNAWALFLVYGAYAAATEGVSAAFVTDLAPKEAKRNALLWFNGIIGVAALPANLVAGWLWSAVGSSAAFSFGAWAAAVAVCLSVAWLPWLRSSQQNKQKITA